MHRKSARELPIGSPIAFGPVSNGEFEPGPPTARDREAERRFHELARERAAKTGLSRREFVASAQGLATALLVVNQVYGCGSDERVGAVSGPGPDGGAPDGSISEGGLYDVNDAMTYDADAACERLGGDEFVFDVQTHHVNPNGAWRTLDPDWEGFLEGLPQSQCGLADHVDCFSAEAFVREVFVNSDTAVACLTGVPVNTETDPLGIADRVATRELVNRLANSQRLLIHASVLPNRGPAALDSMQALAEAQKVSAWKLYTTFGDWQLDDPAIGIPFLERARATGVKVVCVHKGISGTPLDYASPGSPRDMAVMAKAYPDFKFLVYHSSWEGRAAEGPYNAANPQGVDRLIKAVLDNGLANTGNLYAELGSTWWNLMTRPTEAAHFLGKLLKYVGEDRIVWGTDSIWYGSPQAQIAAFRAFQIPPALQQEFGYPALTPEIRRKILGLNGAAVYGVDPDAVRCKIATDELSQLKLDPPPWPTGIQYGPRSRREFLRLLAGGGHAHG